MSSVRRFRQAVEQGKWYDDDAWHLVAMPVGASGDVNSGGVLGGGDWRGCACVGVGIEGQQTTLGLKDPMVSRMGSEMTRCRIK